MPFPRSLPWSPLLRVLRSTASTTFTYCPPRVRHLSPTAPPQPFHGLNCLVTGASRGIGAGIAQALADRGANLHLVARNEAALRETSARLAEPQRDDSSAEATVSYTAGDVASAAFWEALMRDRDVDVLVNAAGVAF